MAAPGNIQRAENTRDDWRTPPALFKVLNSEFKFTLDAAASKDNALAPRYMSLPCTGERSCMCGLCSAWSGTVFLNPPYGFGLQSWMHKCIREAEAGATVVALVPSATEAYWYQLAMCTVDEERRLVRRISFLDPETGKPKGGNTRGSTVFVWRPYPQCRVGHHPSSFYWHWENIVGMS